MQPANNQARIGGSADLAHLLRSAGDGGAVDAYLGKRHALRVSDGCLLEVSLGPATPKTTWTVYMHNVSDTGCAFWSKRDVPIRSSLFLRECRDDGCSGWLRARVTHCTRGIRGFLIGAAFELGPPSP